MRQAITVLLVLAGLALAAHTGWQAMQRRHYTGLLPPDIGVQGVRHLGVQDGLREGCGAVVFALDAATTQRLQQQGLAGLTPAPDAQHRMGPWQATPTPAQGPLRDLLDQGLGCAALPPDLARVVDTAQAQPGAYFSARPDAALLLLPAQGLAVLVLVG